MKKRLSILAAVLCLLVLAVPMTVLADTSHSISVKILSEDGKTVSEGKITAEDGKDQSVVIRQNAGAAVTGLKADGRELTGLKQYIYTTEKGNRAVMYTFPKVTSDHTLEAVCSETLQKDAVTAARQKAEDVKNEISALQHLTEEQRDSMTAYIDQVNANGKTTIERALTGDEAAAAKDSALQDMESQLTSAKHLDEDAAHAAAVSAAQEELSKEKLTLKKKTGPKARAVKLSWKKVSGAAGYQVCCKAAGGKYRAVKTLKKTSWTSGKLTKGRTYLYRIRAYRTVGTEKVWSPYSGSVTVKIG